MRIGILPFARATFDVAYAEEKLSAMLAALDATGHDILGPRALLFDAEATDTAIEDLKAARPDQILILQVTFTDAALTMRVAETFGQPLSVWAVPEPRAGGRLRLNAFCGLNLASHALARAGRSFGWLYADGPHADLEGLFGGSHGAGQLASTHAPADADGQGARIAAALAERRIGRIGDAPDGFVTCTYDAEEVQAVTGVAVEALQLPDLFDRARAAEGGDVQALRRTAAADLDGLDDVDQEELDRSLRLKLALDALRADRSYDAFAIRCWPETFTEYGGAVCGPVSMLGEARVPCACEADVYGAVTQLLLQETAEAPVFLVDLVDMDTQDDTGVVWHCGQAPLSMADPDVRAEATIHTNRRMPLLYEFPLKPGFVTFARISQTANGPRLVLAAGEMLKRPMAFTGTSGVVRFNRPADEVLRDVIASGLEHHMGLVYGDHRAALRNAASALSLPLVEL